MLGNHILKPNIKDNKGYIPFVVTNQDIVKVEFYQNIILKNNIHESDLTIFLKIYCSNTPLDLCRKC